MGSVTIQPAVRQETGKIAAGVGVLSVLTAAVYLILGRFNYTVLLGLLLGMAFAIGNFFLMALTVQHAAEKMNGVEVPAEPETEDGEEPPQQELSPQAKQAKKRMQLSYMGRMAMLVVVAVVAIKLPCFDAVPALIVQLFPRITVFIEGLMMKKEQNAQ